MVKPNEATELTSTSNQTWGYLEALKSSPLLYLSAGAKELFHSDFLYWLATSHWDVFIRVMRNLAGLEDDEPFWWEESSNHKDGNLKVLREQSHFDLSIYYRFVEDKWVPVLILENKVKSLPNVKQLNEYSINAEKEWHGRENNGKNLMTFLLLSLTDASNLSCEAKAWTFKKYADLMRALENNLESSRMSSFHKQLCNNYCEFVRALSGLAESWRIDVNEKYQIRFSPDTLKTNKYKKDEDNKKADDAYDEYKKLSELRLDDIWYKISFENLRILVEKRLMKEGINCRWFNRNNDGEMPGFYLNTGYSSRGHRGLIELRYVLENHSFKNEPVCMMVQIEGCQYRYAVLADELMNKKSVNPNWECLKNNKIKPATIHNIQNWITSKPMRGKNAWCRFGDSFIYRYKRIEPSEKIKDIIDRIVQDAREILNCLGKN